MAKQDDDITVVYEQNMNAKSVSWENIHGLDSIKIELQTAIECLKAGSPAMYNIILFGPPSCGKSLVAKAIANECNLNFISINANELLQKFSESIEAVDVFLERLTQTSSCLYFFDNLHVFNHVKDASLYIGNRIEKYQGERNIFFIGATEKLEFPEYFFGTIKSNKVVCVPLPKNETRKYILLKNLKRSNIDSDVDLTKAAKATYGYTAGDIVNVCRLARKIAISDSKQIRPNEPSTSTKVTVRISHDQFDKALRNVKKSVTTSEIQEFNKLSKVILKLKDALFATKNHIMHKSIEDIKSGIKKDLLDMFSNELNKAVRDLLPELTLEKREKLLNILSGYIKSEIESATYEEIFYKGFLINSKGNLISESQKQKLLKAKPSDFVSYFQNFLI